MCDSQGITDRVLALAAKESGVKYSELRLPAELCVWVDPNEVACRFGDELGSFLPIYMNEDGNKRSFIDKFDFGRLCQRMAPMPINTGRSSMAVERSYSNRVSIQKPGSGMYERVPGTARCHTNSPEQHQNGEAARQHRASESSLGSNNTSTASGTAAAVSKYSRSRKNKSR